PLHFHLFFFSSRRRHTIFSRDWSSDVCSSDLLTYHHTPFFFYAPEKLTPKKIAHIGLQIDTPAMICSYLGIENNKTLGIPFDIHPRKYAYFSADDKVGVLDEEYFYIWNKNGQEYLYKYKTPDNTNYLKQYPEKANEMKKYAFSMIMN